MPRSRRFSSTTRLSSASIADASIYARYSSRNARDPIIKQQPNQEPISRVEPWKKAPLKGHTEEPLPCRGKARRRRWTVMGPAPTPQLPPSASLRRLTRPERVRRGEEALEVR